MSDHTTNRRESLTEHLDSSIERVHQDLEAVSFWAHAVSGFAQPIPAYVPEECVNGFQAHPIMAAPKETANERTTDKAAKNGKPKPARRRA